MDLRVPVQQYPQAVKIPLGPSSGVLRCVRMDGTRLATATATTTVIVLAALGCGVDEGVVATVGGRQVEVADIQAYLAAATGMSWQVGRRASGVPAARSVPRPRGDGGFGRTVPVAGDPP